MRPSALRALLLALAMVFQTIAGGVSVAHAATGASPQAVSGHCDFMRGPHHGEPAGKAGSHDGRHIMCLSCLLCAGPPTVSIDQRTDIVLERRSCAVIGFTSSEILRLVSRAAQTSRARAPPAAA
ncbi:hypothetical protein LG047_17350 [Methylocystis sp. WRRC1]|uniref:hypothetical protein n=1 Tax=Methylocystis sp. WRRC1 TaxID=1732014 RepID=UPI001D15B262|nr:hypothetical protein [Methylocystis sp. WRRC1]MCC3247063.1 hypothetical protein [Methylocystis sp. WRRC1]